MIRLENWSVCWKNNNPFSPPEFGVQALQGEAYGHPRFNDGDHVVTTRIVAVTPDGIVTTGSGSTYILGQVDAKYEAEYPNARNRLILSAAKFETAVQ